MNVIKRNGAETIFDPEKIVDAISKVNNDCSGYDRVDDQTAHDVTTTVVAKCSLLNRAVHVEEIQDMVEKELMIAGKHEASKQYIIYRFKRSQARHQKILTEKLTASNVQNQNANVDEMSFGGRLGEAAAFVTKQYALDNLMSKMASKNHVNNEIYSHDLDSYAIGSHNCLSIPFDELLAKGFNTRQTDVRPAGSINTAMQLVAVIFQLQSLQQFGGVAATHLDWTMVPYVRLSFYKHYVDGIRYLCGTGNVSDDYTKEEIRELPIDSSYYCENTAYKYAMDKTVQELNQAIEGMYHNLNTLQSRSGNQLPFTSINYGTCTLPEGRMVTKALIEGSISGVGKFHKTSIFPCGIFQCMKGVNRKPGDPNYDLFRLALKSTALRIYPNYANCDWSVDFAAYMQDRDSKKAIIDKLTHQEKQVLADKISSRPDLREFLMLDIHRNPTDNTWDLEVDMTRRPYEMMSTMGCRTYNGFDINSIESYEKNIRAVIEGRPLYDDVASGVAKDGRGNICPVTIVLPVLAMQAPKVDEFLALLEKKIDEAKDQLIERYNWICKQSYKSAKFMYENGTMHGYVAEEGIKSALRHGTLVIGQIGIAETLQILMGCDHTDPKGMIVAKQIEYLFKSKCAEFKKEYKLNFGVYYTPAENMAYTSMKKFREAYGIIPKVSDHDYFTNSMHVPVWHKMTPFEKIDLESQLTGYSSGGCITYVELDSSAKNNIDAMEELVNYAMDKDIPYFAINVPIDTCQTCGYQDDISGDACPKCGGTRIQRLRRVTGYITDDYLTAFNPGKQKEVEDRAKHNGIEA